MSFCGAQLRSGFDLVAEITSLRDRIAKADLVLTGEGKLDGQTLHGKGPMGVAQMAREFGKPVAAIMGDGAAGFHIAEFDTMVRHGLPILTIVFNNEDRKQSPVGYEQYDKITVTRQVRQYARVCVPVRAH